MSGHVIPGQELALEGNHRTVAGQHADPPRTIGYVPALDGVRALAITAVLLLHGGVSWAQGGYLGVDVFFVLSGYLITTLLLTEHRRAGRIALGRFWAHRARRLLPALFAMLVLVAAYAAYWAPTGTQGAIRGDAIATLLYYANWHYAFGGLSYFAQLSAPSPLLHTWTLAIEEQFYLLWPLVVVACLRAGRSRRLLLAVSVIGAGASAVAMGVLFGDGTNLNRAYYGTDTRAQALLIGAVVAVWLARPAPARADHRMKPPQRWFRPLPSLIASAAGLGVLGWMVVAATSNGQAPNWMYHGGFAAAALAAAVVVWCVVTAPESLWARALSLRPIRYVGRISYGLYLWHEPLFLIVDHGRTGLVGLPLLAVRLAVTFAVSVASYHLLEMPIRTGTLQRRLSRGFRWALLPLIGGATAGVVLVATVSAPGTAALATNTPTIPATPPHAQLASGVDSFLPVIPPVSTGPIRVLIVGDSLAFSLAFGLLAGGPRYDLNLQTDGVISCGLVVSRAVSNRGMTLSEVVGIAAADKLIRCADLPTRWGNDVARFNPDVVVMVDGPWEVRDHEIDGKWIHIGERGFDRLEVNAMERAVRLLSSRGAHVVLLTCPYISQPEQSNGQPWPDDNPIRVNIYNDLLRQVASQFPKTAQVIPLGAHVSPGGHFASVIDGVDIRDPDGIHFSIAGGQFLQPWLLPQLESIGMSARRTTHPEASPARANP